MAILAEAFFDTLYMNKINYAISQDALVFGSPRLWKAVNQMGIRFVRRLCKYSILICTADWLLICWSVIMIIIIINHKDFPYPNPICNVQKSLCVPNKRCPLSAMLDKNVAKF